MGRAAKTRTPCGEYHSEWKCYQSNASVVFYSTLHYSTLQSTLYSKYSTLHYTTLHYSTVYTLLYCV